MKLKCDSDSDRCVTRVTSKESYPDTVIRAGAHMVWWIQYWSELDHIYIVRDSDSSEREEVRN